MINQSKPEYLTRAKYQAYKKQLEYMKREGSVKLAELLASSPGSGMGRPLDLPIHDLARDFRAQMAEIEAKLYNAVVIEEYLESKEQRGTVDIGASVTIHDLESGEESKYTIVGSDETSPPHGRISYLSPLGSALMGKRQGDIVEIKASRARFKVVRVEYQPLDYPIELVDWDDILTNTMT